MYWALRETTFSPTVLIIYYKVYNIFLRHCIYKDYFNFDHVIYVFISVIFGLELLNQLDFNFPLHSYHTFEKGRIQIKLIGKIQPKTKFLTITTIM